MRSTTFALLLSLAAFPALAAVTGTVMTADGAPLPGARVSLYGYESAAARRARLLSATPEAVPLASAQTDAKGNFSLESPKEATAALRVFLRGYEPYERRVERDEDAGAIALVSAEMRSGSVSAAGKPVAGAVVSILYSGAEFVTKTNEQGRYDAPDPRHARSISVIHPDFAIDHESLIVVGGTVPASKLSRTLTAGGTIAGRVVASDGTSAVADAVIDVDGWPLARSGDAGSFTVAHAPTRWTMLTARKDALLAQRAFSNDKTHTLRLGRAAIVAGRVTDAKSKLPVAGAIVRLAPQRRLGPGGFDGGETALSDAKGAFTMTAAPGSYDLFAVHPAFDGLPADVAAVAGQTTSRDLALDPLARISGIVVDESRKPVAAARMSIEETRDMRMGGFSGTMRFAVSGPDGRYSILSGSENEFRVAAAKKGMPSAKSDTLRVAPGDRRSGVVITVPSGVAVTGRITDREGKALSGVAITTAETPQGPRGGMRRMMFTGPGEGDDNAVRTASDGTFAMRLKEGTYDFTFRRDGYAPKTVRAQSISASGENTIETALDIAASISGRVVRSGNGVEGVNVISFSAMDAGAVTGPDGSFTMSGLAPGPTRVMLRKETDFINETRNIEAPAQDVVIELPAGTRISGHVYEKGTRKPITSFQAGISTSRSGGGMVMMGPPQLRSFTSDDGAFTLENVPSGAITVIASAPGYASARSALNVEEGKPVTDLALELDTGVKLTGKVTDPNGAPLRDVVVRVAPSPTGSFAMSGSQRQAMTDANGEYAIQAMEPGEETIEFSHPKYLATRKDVTLKGRETRLDAQLAAGERVTGIVVTEAGAPVAEATVEAMAAGGSMRVTRTDASGTFAFDSLAPARYRFAANKSGFAEGTLEDFDIGAGAQPRITLRTGGVVYGHVSGLTEQELAATTVDVRAPGSMAQATVDASGNYRLEGAPTGTVRVSATSLSGDFSRRRTSRVETAEVAPGGSVQVDLQFRSDTVVRGRVTRNGRPLADAQVAFVPRTGRTNASASTTTDAQGNYSVTGIDDGEYTVSIMDMQRFSPYSTTYRVSGSGTFDVDYSAGAVRGRVVDAATNEPVSEATVQLRSTSTTDFRSSRAAATDANGNFTIDFVPAGSYSVNATKEGYGGQPRDLSVGDSGRDDVELALVRTDGVLLRVVDARDGRLLSPMVWVYDSAGRVMNDGRMWFRSDTASEQKLSLSPGAYTATVMAMNYAPRHVAFQSPSTQTVALTPGGTLRIRSKHPEPRMVRVIDANGIAYPRTGMRPPITMLNPSPGITTLDTIAPGLYTLQLLGENETVIDQVQVTVTEQGVTDTEI